MRTKGTAEELEARRNLAIELWQEGKSQCEVARLLKVNDRTVREWVERYREEGKRGLRARKTPGRPARLGKEALLKLEKILLEGATAAGYPNELWTGRRVAEVIAKRFKVEFHWKYIPELLKRMGWSVQKPQRKAIERDEEAIALWKKREWPRIKKKRAKRAPK